VRVAAYKHGRAWQRRWLCLSKNTRNTHRKRQRIEQRSKASTCGAIADIKLHRGYPRGGEGPLHLLGGAQALSGQPEGSLGDAVVIIAVGGDLYARANQLRDTTEEDNNDT
jgi:hypothetical protein